MEMTRRESLLLLGCTERLQFAFESSRAVRCGVWNEGRRNEQMIAQPL